MPLIFISPFKYAVTQLPVIDDVSDNSSKYTTMHLLTSNVTGATTTQLVDSSPNNIAVSVTGSIQQGTFSPTSANGWSGQFGYGLSAGILLTDHVGLQMGTGNFTYEAWICPSKVPAAITRVFTYVAAGTSTDVEINLLSTGRIRIEARSSNGKGLIGLEGTTVIAPNKWYHVAFVRNGTTLTLYINGVAESTQINQSHTLGAGVPSIGYYAAGNNGYFDGLISNLRVVKGTAVYTAPFTPSTEPLTAITGTTLLCLQDNRLIDRSLSNTAMTSIGSLPCVPMSARGVTENWSDARGGSCALASTGNYVTVPNSSNLTLSGDFTVEGWFNTSSTAASPSFFCIGRSDSSQNGLLVYYANAASALRVYQNNAVMIAGPTLYNNQWYHIAVVRSGTTVTLYVNGIVRGTATNSTTIVGNVSSGCVIGAEYKGVYSGNNGFNFSDFRITKSAVYTAAFNPPTSSLNAIANTSLLIKGANAGIYDNVSRRNLASVGATVSATTSKYDIGSVYFNGSSHVYASPSSDFDFGNGDGAVEMWIYPTVLSPSGDKILLDFRGNSTIGLAFFINSSQYLQVYNSVGSALMTAGTAAQVKVNEWQHVALIKSGTTWTYYLNQVSVGSFTISNATLPVNTGLRIGMRQDNTSGFSGYMEDLRITRGITRSIAS